MRAVDEKLFAMGAANMDDPLGELYASTDSGLVGDGLVPREARSGTRATARATTGGGGGDRGGREDFRDWLVAKLVTTGADGRATVSFDLSDDLTSWRVVGSAITAGLQAGVGHVHVPVGLPFFAEVVVAPEYLAVDRPAVRLRAYGSALRAGDPVRFTVTSGTVPLAAVTADATAFEPVEVELPAMPVGTHRLRVTATAPGRTPALSDTITRTLRGREDAGHPVPRHLRPAHPGHDRGRRRRSHAGDPRRRRPRPRRAAAARSCRCRALPR